MERDSVLVATDVWKSAFPGASVGALVMSGVDNPERSEPLDARKRELEESLRADAARVGPEGLAGQPMFRAYLDYYRTHGKTYHVKAQWESVAVKGKPIPSRAALVEAMFMAELKNLLLTAGHDLTAVALPVRVDVTREGDRYVAINGTERVPAAGDMMMVDGEGIISSVRGLRAGRSGRERRPKPPRGHRRQRAARCPASGDRAAGHVGGRVTARAPVRTPVDA